MSGSSEAILNDKERFVQNLYSWKIISDGKSPINADSNTLDKYRLKEGALDILSNNGPVNIHLDTSPAFNNAVRAGSGFSMILGMAGDGGHATLIQKRDDNFIFYDPNFGVYSFTSKEELENFLRNFTSIIYANMKIFFLREYVT